MPPLLLPLIGALFIGVTLGLLGSGGSIFSVPILHFGLGWSEKQAVAGSLFVVGMLSTIALVPRAWTRQVRWSTALWFGIPGLVGTFAGAWVSRWVPGGVQMALFGVVMGVAAFFMARPAHLSGRQAAVRLRWKVAVDGLSIGALTGLVGVGGGFMIVPALVLLSGLDIHLAVGTSLAIIAANSIVGLTEHLRVLSELGLSLDWPILWLFVLFGSIGSLLGGRLATRIPRPLLQRGFAFVLVGMATFILSEAAYERWGADRPGPVDGAIGAPVEAPAQ